MLLCTLMWSLGGVVSRHFESHEGLEITFWRSVFAALTVAVVLAWQVRFGRTAQGAASPWAALNPKRHPMAWVSGLMWACMFTCYMVSLSLTSVANVLITQSMAPVFTALLARVVLRKPIGAFSWGCIAIASAGIAGMYVLDVAGLDGRQLVGVLIALGIPLAAAVNWVMLQRAGEGEGADLSSAVLIGGTLSALATLPFAWPLGMSAHDMGLLVLLGVVQLGIPCVLVMRVARHMAAHRVALLSLLEVVFGIVLAWALAGEKPATATLLGGTAVLLALVANELRASHTQA